MLDKLSLQNIVKEYKNNLEISKENLDSETDSKTDFKTDSKTSNVLPVGLFVTLLIIATVIYIWAIVLLIKHWNKLNDVSKIIGLFGVLPNVPIGPIMTIVVVKLNIK